MNYIDIIPKMDASVATISKDFICTECGNSGIDYPLMDKPTLIGYCETPDGFMMILECPHCFTKWRIHGSAVNKNDVFTFEQTLRSFVIARYFSNSQELESTRKEKEEKNNMTGVFCYKGYILTLINNKDDTRTVHIRQLNGTHVWTVSIDAPSTLTRNEIGELAIQAYKNQHESISV